MVSSPIYSILLNGSPTKYFNHTWGLRQGDPLSPILFILANEDLGRLLKKEAHNLKIHGLRLWGNDLPLTHQQFFDNIMLFCHV